MARSDMPTRDAVDPSSRDGIETAELHQPESLWDATAAAAPIGASASRYVILGEVGRGGMGRVLRAYDPTLQREVALKEVRADLLSESGSRRLVAEARAMAKLSHPNVVAVYDVQDDGPGQVVLVMEYVAGTTLKAWLEAPRDMREIVQRFVAAGQGLRAAHDAGLLHRDFKPANVLVNEVPPQPFGPEPGRSVLRTLAKVTDFGLAKPAAAVEISEGRDSSRATNSTKGTTETGVVAGTPRYMAPEQHRGETLTAAADQYAFCVALWEALCGAPPVRGRRLLQRKLAGPPPWPRSGPSGPIVRAIMRGLAAEPEDRWPGMEPLLEVLSVDPRQRRRRLLAGGGVVVLGIAGVAWMRLAGASAAQCTGAAEQLNGVWDDAHRSSVHQAFVSVESLYAEDAWERTRETLDRYAADWIAMHTETCEATTVRSEQSTAVMDLRMACLHRARVELGAASGVLAEADATVVRKVAGIVGNLPGLARCADVEALQAEVEPPAPADADAVEHIRVLLAAARAERLAGRYDTAQTTLDQVRQRQAAVAYEPIRIEIALEDGHVLDAKGEYEASEAALWKALRLAMKWRQRDGMHDAASMLMFVVGQQQRRAEVGLRYLELARGLAADDPANLAEVHNYLALILEVQGRMAEAEIESRRSLELKLETFGPEHPAIANSRNNLATLLGERGKNAEAEAQYRLALPRFEKQLGTDHPHVAALRSNMAAALVAQGKYADAEGQQRRALAVLEESLGAQHPHVGAVYTNLAVILFLQNQFEEAEAVSRRALALRQAALGADHPEVAVSRNNLANVLSAQGKTAEAEEEYRRSLASLVRELGLEHPLTASAQDNLGLLLYDQGKYAEAEPKLRGALTVRQKTLAPDHPDVALSRSNLAALLVEYGNPKEALELAELAWAHRRNEDTVPEDRATTAFVLAKSLWASNDPGARSRARALAKRALSIYVAAGSDYDDNAAEIRNWLQAHDS